MLKKIRRQFGWMKDAYGGGYVVGIIAMLLNDVVYIFPPRIAGHLADHIIAQDITFERFLVMLGYLVLLTLLNYITGYLFGYYVFKAGDVSALLIRYRSARKIFSQSAPFFGKNTTGSLMGKLTNDVDAVADMTGYGLMSLSDSILYPLVIVIIMLFTSWKLTIFTLLPFPLLVFATKKAGSFLYPRYFETQKAFDALNDHVLENVSGVRVVRAFNLEDAQTEKADRLSKDLFDKNMKLATASALFTPSSKLVSGLTYLIALILGAYYVHAGSLTVGSLMAFIFYLSMMTWPMMAMGEFMNVGQQGLASMERIREIWAYEEDMKDPDRPLPLDRLGRIEFDHFNFCWPDHEQPVLSDLTFTIEEGMTVGVVGRVGSGKTALLKQFLRFYPQPADGIDIRENEPAYRAMRVNGEPIQRYRRADLRRRIGYVPQQATLFSKTVLENILMGDRREIGRWPLSEDDLAREAAFYHRSIYRLNREMNAREASPKPAPDYDKNALALALDASDFRKDLSALPQGLDTMAGEKGIALSGGQKQRISIARALISDPELLILDDSLSAVDGNTEETVLRELRRLRRGKSTVISAHRLSAVMEADLILVLDEGRIVAQGTHDDLMREGGWYRDQYLKQQLEKGDLRHEA